MQEIIFLNLKKIVTSQKNFVIVLIAAILSIKVMEAKIKSYQLKIILMKLNHI